MYHSIMIGTKNTWDDWHLIPTSRPLFNPPAVKVNTVDIPGGDGVLDLSTALSGRPLYNNRTGSISFYVENGFKPWSEMFSEIMAYLHGQRLRAVLEDDPNYYYEGRFSVNAWKSDAERSTITIDYDLAPYKKDISVVDDDWFWDTFNFETGVIHNYRNLIVNGELDVNVIIAVNSVVPLIVVDSDEMTVSYDDETYELIKGVNLIDELVLQNGSNILTFSGNGKVTVKVNEGLL